MLKQRPNETNDTASVLTQSPISKKEKTIIGEYITIEGTIRDNGKLVVEGLVKGSRELEKKRALRGRQGQGVGGNPYRENLLSREKRSIFHIRFLIGEKL